MERNVVSLELAKKLKWKQTTAFKWQQFYGEDVGDGQPLEAAVVASEVEPDPDNRYYSYPAPTAQELADALNRDIYLTFKVEIGLWMAFSEMPGTGKAAGTMANALALLWLEVNGG